MALRFVGGKQLNVTSVATHDCGWQFLRAKRSHLPWMLKQPQCMCHDLRGFRGKHRTLLYRGIGQGRGCTARGMQTNAKGTTSTRSASAVAWLH